MALFDNNPLQSLYAPVKSGIGNLFEGMTKTKDATFFSILPLVSGLPLKSENKTNKKASK